MVLKRRHLLSEERPVSAVLLDLVLAAVLISRVARCHAAAAGRSKANQVDLREGIATAELMITSHASVVPVNLRLQATLVERPEDIRRMLASEVAG